MVLLFGKYFIFIVRGTHVNSKLITHILTYSLYTWLYNEQKTHMPKNILITKKTILMCIDLYGL